MYPISYSIIQDESAGADDFHHDPSIHDGNSALIQLDGEDPQNNVMVTNQALPTAILTSSPGGNQAPTMVTATTNVVAPTGATPIINSVHNDNRIRPAMIWKAAPPSIGKGEDFAL